MPDTSQVSYAKEDIIILLSQHKIYPEKERHVSSKKKLEIIWKWSDSITLDKYILQIKSPR